MLDYGIIEKINSAVESAKKRHPEFCSGDREKFVSLLAEEVGEFAQAVNDGDEKAAEREILDIASLCYRYLDFFDECGNFTDKRDGITYKTVKIGDKIWMAENLRYKCGGACDYKCTNGIVPENSGKLYSWHAAITAPPNGWRLPSVEEIETAKNDCRFIITKSGCRSGDGSFTGSGREAYVWTSEENGRGYALALCDDGFKNVHSYDKNSFFSVRCVKDCE